MLPKRKTVLIVDDDADSRIVLARLLRQESYRILVARHGKEALRRTQVVIPDLIVLDVRMPVMDGQTFAKLLKKRPALFGTPVIAITAYASDELASLPVDAVLQKPLDFDHLAMLASDLIRRGRHRPKLGDLRVLDIKRPDPAR